MSGGAAEWWSELVARGPALQLLSPLAPRVDFVQCARVRARAWTCVHLRAPCLRVRACARVCAFPRNAGKMTTAARPTFHPKQGGNNTSMLQGAYFTGGACACVCAGQALGGVCRVARQCVRVGVCCRVPAL